MCFDMDRSLKPVKNALHHILSDAPAGNFRDYFCRTESGPEDEFERLGVAHTGRFLRGNQSQLGALGAHLLGIDAAPIVADLDHNLIALMKSMQPDLSMRRLAQAPAQLGRLNAMTDRVPHQMRERLGDGVDNTFIQVGLLSAEFQIHFPLALPSHLSLSIPQRAGTPTSS